MSVLRDVFWINEWIKLKYCKEGIKSFVTTKFEKGSFDVF